MPVRRLDPVLVDRIAAGEVVERPAAAVKELVENALDAGASRIDVAIELGGRRLIRVIDNGSGMPAARSRARGRAPCDLETARQRSHPNRDARLSRRGAAVDRLRRDARYLFARGRRAARIFDPGRSRHKSTQLAPCGDPPGTKVEVRDLFAATPARLKFLKSDRVEARACADIVQRLAMANPHVRFTFSGTETASFDLAAQGDGENALLTRLADILGDEFRANALLIEAAREGFRLEGYADLPTWHKATAQAQYLFVNGRPVRDKLLIGAVRAAYMDYLPQGRHPALVLFLNCDPREVDVNVHPAKAEVRFRDFGLVRGLLIGALKQSLQSALHRATPAHGAAALDVFARRASANSAAPAYRAPAAGWDWRQSPAYPGFAESAATEPGGLALIGEAFTADTRAHAQPPAPEDIDAPLGAARAQLHDTYIVAQTRDGIVIVDQHAAHERLVYEGLKAARANKQVPRQALLIPVIVDMEQADVERIEDVGPLLQEFGLYVEAFGPGARRCS